MHLWFYRLWCK